MRKVRTSLYPLLAALLLAALLAAACTPAAPTPSTQGGLPTSVVPKTGEEEEKGPSGPLVEVKDQDYQGNRVVIERVVSEGPGWIAIHVQNEAGRVGDAIAYAPVKTGENRNVTVEIDPAKASETLYAMLHTDVGAVGTYEFPGPDVPVLVAGEMVNPSFVARPAQGEAAQPPYVKVNDQEVVDGKVLVEEVFSPGPGWVDIHVQTPDGERGVDIGFAPVRQGVNRNIIVTIDPGKVTPVLYAVLHTDAGEVGVYELPPGPDVNVEVDGEVVGPTFRTDGLASADAAATAVATADAVAAATEPAGETPEATEVAQVTAESTAEEPAETPGPQAEEHVMETPAADATQAPLTDGPEPFIEVVDQPIQGGMVIVSEVFTIGESWLVIHKQNPDGSMGTFIGFTRLEDGLHQNVQVPVNTGLVTPVLYAMLHEDHEPVFELEFPGSDVPVTANGEVIAPSFNVLTAGRQDVIINTSTDPSTQKYLVDNRGRALYISLEDSPGVSNCNRVCQGQWRPLLATGRIVPGAGVARAKLGVLIHPDGSRQITYAGLPLYTYVNDTESGDTKGQGLDGLWFLVNP